MRVVGLIGGMSWKTTSLYYQEINKHVNRRLGGLHSPRLLIQSLDYAEVARMVSDGSFDELTQHFGQAGRSLKLAGAQALVLCANVAHKTAEGLETTTALPVLHIADFVGQEIVNSGHKTVGLLGTRAVMQEAFYRERLRKKFGLEVFVPNEFFQEQADRHIFHEMSKEVIPDDIRSAWYTAYHDLKRLHQVDCIALACTELRLLFNGETSLPTFETTEVHARGIANWALRE